MKMKNILSLALVFVLSVSLIKTNEKISADEVTYPSNYAVDFGNYSKWLRSSDGGVWLTGPSYDDGIISAELTSEKITVNPSQGSVGGQLYTLVNINLDKLDYLSYSMNISGEGAVKIRDGATGAEYTVYKNKGAYNEKLTDIRQFFADRGVTGNKTLEVQLHGYFNTAEFYNVSFVSESQNIYAKLGMERYKDWLMPSSGGVYMNDKSCSDDMLNYYVSDGKIILSPVEGSVGGFIYFPITMNLDEIECMNFALQTKNEAVIKLREDKTGKELALTKKNGNFEESFDIRGEFAKMGISGRSTFMVQLHSYFDETIYTKVEFIKKAVQAAPEEATVIRNPNFNVDLISDNSTDYRLIAEDNATCRFAASEFKEYMKKMTGVDMAVDTVKQPGQKYIVFGTGTGASIIIDSKIDTSKLKFDGFQITQEGEDIVFSSNYPRGVLYAVYDFIESQGASFVCQVNTEEYVPVRSEVSLNGEVVSNPALEIRGMSEAPWDPNAQWLENFEKTLDLWAKNKINSIFIHVSAGWNITGCMADAADIIKLRDMQLEVGGHGIYNYVPRSLFDTKPELFRMADGVRTPTGNICASSDEAIQMIADGVLRYFSQNPDVDVYRGWFEDVTGGSWCSCPDCKDITPLQQQYNVLAKVNKQVADEFPGKKVDMLLYHDTIENIDTIDTSVNPGNASKIDGLYAPRERCYAHALDDSECELNKFYLKALKDTVSVFGTDSCTSFEYYADFVLYQICETNFAKTIARDMQVYQREGMLRVTPLTFDNYSNWAYGLNNYVFSRHAWNPSLNIDDTIKTYSDTIGFDVSDSGYTEYLELIEKASAKIYAYCGYDVQYRNIPEMDPTPLSYYAECVENLKEAMTILSEAKEKLEILKDSSNDKTTAFLNAESKLLEITSLNVEAFYNFMQGRYYLYAAPGVYTDDEIWDYYYKAESNKNKMKDIVNSLGNEYLGVKGQHEIADVFCGVDFMRGVYDREVRALNSYYYVVPEKYTVIKDMPNDAYTGWKAIGDTVLDSNVTTDSFGKYTFEESGINVLSHGTLGYSFISYDLGLVNLNDDISLLFDADATRGMTVKVIYYVNGDERAFVFDKPAGKYENAAMNISRALKAEGITGEIELSLQLVAFDGGTGVTFSDIKLVKTKQDTVHEHIAGNWETTVEAGCTETGTKVKKCTDCGEILESETIPAKGHEFGEWKVTKQPTAEQDGEETRTCKHCSETERKAIKFKDEENSQTGDQNIAYLIMACLASAAIPLGTIMRKRRKERIV